MLAWLGSVWPQTIFICGWPTNKEIFKSEADYKNDLHEILAPCRYSSRRRNFKGIAWKVCSCYRWMDKKVNSLRGHFCGSPCSLVIKRVWYNSTFISPLLNEEKLGSREHFDLIEYVLSLYNKSLENVVALIGDNAETNKCPATQIDKQFIGCASHRLSLAIKDYLARYDTILAKINGLMGKLKSVKLSAKLRKYTDLRPKQQNETRGSSIAEMVERYLSIKDYLVHFDEQILIEFLLDPCI